MAENTGGSIPMSNLTKLKRSLEYKTLRAVMAQHIKSHLKKKMIFVQVQLYDNNNAEGYVGNIGKNRCRR